MIKKTDVESHIAFIRIPKPLIHDPRYGQLSLDAKFMYGLLYDRLQLSLKNKWYDSDGLIFQYYKNEQFMIDLSASEKTVIKLKKELSSVGLLKEVRQGVNLPNRLYLGAVIGTVKSTGQELENLQLGAVENTVLELENLQGNKTEKNKTEKSNNILSICKEVISYLNKKANKHFNTETVSHHKFIKARLKEGYTLEDFKKVVDIMSANWVGTDYENGLRPKTLFSNSMDDYLNFKMPKSYQEPTATDIEERLGF